MKLRNLTAAILVLTAASAFGQNNSGLKRMPNGLEYQVFTSGGGPKIKLNDVVTFNVTEKTDKDSVLSSSFGTGQPARIQIQPSKSSIDLMDFFQLLAQGDSAMVKVPADSLFADTTRMQRPSFFPEGSHLNLYMKIEKVQSEAEIQAEQQKMMDAYKRSMDSLKTNEQVLLNKYIADNKLTPVQTASGLRYIITSAGKGIKPVAGDSVWVNYTGRTLDGKVFDSSVESVAKEAGLEQPGRTYEPISFPVGEGAVIKGWDEGLQLLNSGSKAKFIIPSDLAYGPRGAGEDIKPFSTLVFDVELVKVKHQQPAVKEKAPAPVKKTAPARKPGTPVKKSTAAPKKASSPPVKKK